ncbi:MAG: hypothetical protein B6241_06590 [Spirochaetaceae bacterium 4572_59]|nr:MAG: hypothetical protein B6241_06590 [Spirochaetaceae bacterium 4572_59]
MKAFMNKNILFCLYIFLISFSLFSQSEDPRVEIKIRDEDEYSRHARLEEEDLKRGYSPDFEQGLEIISDMDSAVIYIAENEIDKTPYENNKISIGYYRIRLEKTGQEDITFWINVKKNKRTTVFVQYLPTLSLEAKQEAKVAVIRQGQAYGSINPEDPYYYIRILFSKNLFMDDNADLIITDSENLPLITLSPVKTLGDTNVYYWEGMDIDGNKTYKGEYSLYSVADFSLNSSFQVDYRYSRKPASYFSGFSGLSLVPSAQPLFAGSFQFGSFISSNFDLEDSEDSSDLPFSFFFRFSPLPRWESAFDFELTVNSDSSTPAIKINTSQKVLISGDGPFLFSINGRFAYRADINDFSEYVYPRMIRDPAGASLAFPVQFKVDLWDFYMAPESLYSFEPLYSGDGHGGADFTAVIRWGISYSNRIFHAGFSSALYLPSLQGTPIIMQSALDMSLNFKDSPFYLNGNIIYQEINDRTKNLTIGMGIGFLL